MKTSGGMMTGRSMILVLLAVSSLPVRAGTKTDPKYPKDLQPVEFVAKYEPMYDLEDLKTHNTCSKLAGVVVLDERKSGELLGVRRFEDDDQSPEAPIRMTGNIIAWIEKSTNRLLPAAGITFEESGSVITIRLKKLELSEEHFDNSTWDGSVQLVVEMGGTPSEPCWTAQYIGRAENWGDPENLVNYIETVNHALDRAVADLVNDPGFAEALCTKCR